MPLDSLRTGSANLFSRERIGKENILHSEDRMLPCWRRQPGRSVVQEGQRWLAPQPPLDMSGLINNRILGGKVSSHLKHHFPNLSSEVPTCHRIYQLWLWSSILTAWLAESPVFVWEIQHTQWNVSSSMWSSIACQAGDQADRCQSHFRELKCSSQEAEDCPSAGTCPRAAEMALLLLIPVFKNMTRNWKHLITMMSVHINESAFACWDLNSVAPGVRNASSQPKVEPRALSCVASSFQFDSFIEQPRDAGALRLWLHVAAGKLQSYQTRVISHLK